MVGALRKSRATGATFMYQALWTKPGGLAIFDMVDPASPLEIGRIVSANASYANRVQLHDKYPFAFLPDCSVCHYSNTTTATATATT